MQGCSALSQLIDFKIKLQLIHVHEAPTIGLQKEGQLKAEFLLTGIAEFSLDEETYKEWSIHSNEHKQVPPYTVFLCQQFASQVAFEDFRSCQEASKSSSAVIQ